MQYMHKWANALAVDGHKGFPFKMATSLIRFSRILVNNTCVTTSVM